MPHYLTATFSATHPRFSAEQARISVITKAGRWRVSAFRVTAGGVLLRDGRRRARADGVQQPRARQSQQLEDSARHYLHSSEGFQWKKGKLYLSALFKWYKDDFLKSLAPNGEEIPTVADYAAQYLPEEDARRVRAERPKVKFLKYNWSLNDVPRNAAAHKK